MARHALPLLTFLALVALAVRFPPARGPSGPLVIVSSDAGCRVGGRALDDRALRFRLAAHADRERDEAHPYRPSESRVLVRVEVGTRWESVYRVLRACSAPEVRIWRVRLEFSGSEPPLDLPLDRDRMVGYAIVTFPRESSLDVILERRRNATRTRVELGCAGRLFPADGVRALEDPIVRFRVYFGCGRRSTLDVSGDVPAAEVARVVRALTGTGGDPPRIVGAPPDSWRAEDLREVARTGSREDVFDCAVEALGSEDPLERELAVRLLGDTGEPAIPVLVRAFERARGLWELEMLWNACERIRAGGGPDANLAEFTEAMEAAAARFGRRPAGD